MKLVKFETVGRGSIAYVNADLVTFFHESIDYQNAVLITFASEGYITVKGTIEEVADKLKG